MDGRNAPTFCHSIMLGSAPALTLCLWLEGREVAFKTTGMPSGRGAYRRVGLQVATVNLSIEY